MTTAMPFSLGNFRFSVDEVSAHGLFARWGKKQWRVVISTSSHRLCFRYEEMKALCDRPILIEADSSSTPQGDYFLASPEVIVADSAVGEAMAGMSFEAGALLLLEGMTVITRFSASEREQLCAWLQETVRPEAKR